MPITSNISQSDSTLKQVPFKADPLSTSFTFDPYTPKTFPTFPTFQTFQTINVSNLPPPQ